MGNMSYCRFENTAKDVQDCIDAIHDQNLTEMSNREQQGFVDFIMKCRYVAEYYEDMDEYEIKEFINNLNHQ